MELDQILKIQDSSNHPYSGTRIHNFAEWKDAVVRGGSPTQWFSKDFSYPNKLYIVEKVIYRTVRINLNSRKIFWFRDFMSDFCEMVEFRSFLEVRKTFKL